MNEMLNQRALQVLKILVERYIQEGNPIGSKTIAEEYALGLSPATIRNILADLEDSGYLISPHTSAGRIPTAQGYRYFVNALLSVQNFPNVDTSSFQDRLNPDQDISHLLQSASSLLSGLTQLVGIVALPKRNRIAFRQVEFLPLSGNRILVILVLNNREVQNRIIYTDRSFSKDELQEAANFLNIHHNGKDLITVRQELQDALQIDRENVSKLLQAVLDVVNENKDYVISDEKPCVVNQDEDLDRIKVLFHAFTQKQAILDLLNHAVEAEGVQIFIGKESGYETLGNCSIVTTSYTMDGELVGSLGVIGPTRMPYERVISAVDITAKLLSAALNQN